MRHHQVRFRITNRSVVRALKPACELTLILPKPFIEAGLDLLAAEIRRARKTCGEECGKWARRGAFFNDYAVIKHRLFAQIDNPRDARPDGRNLSRVMMSPSHAIDFVVCVIGEPQHVTVASKVVA